MEHAEKDNELLRISLRVSKVSLCTMLGDLWGKRLRKVKRGPRTERKNFFLNIACKQHPVDSSHSNLTVDFEDMVNQNSLRLPNGWFRIVDNKSKISLVQPESWEFENQRIYTEILMELSGENGMVCIIKSHGNELNLKDLQFQQILGHLPVKVQAETLVEFVESSAVCLGCRFLEDAVVPLVPHKVGILKSLSETDALPQKRAFSSDCKVIVPSGNQCSKCCDVKKRCQVRMKRREKRTSIHKHCNKRYLTKEEIQQQLNEERKQHRKQLQEQQQSQEYSEESQTSENDEDDGSTSYDDTDSDSEKWMVTKNSKGLTLCRV